MKDPTLLIDADIIAYQAASRNEKKFDFGDTGCGKVVDHNRARRDVDEVIGELCDKLDTNKVIICLSDPDVNFRKQLDPSYKGNRQNVVKPELLSWVKEYLEHEYRSFKRPRLEADDIMGILQTSGDRFVQGPTIIVSEDKDMKTVPGYLFNPRHDKDKPRLIEPLHAYRFLMEQTLTGDATDGYPGCRGIGPKSRFVREVHEAEANRLWGIVVEGYASKGKTEEDALLQARLAHILWASSYNFKTKKVRLWRPERLLG
ncbi:hypothetical protein [Microbulbifer discodermiae]|uniref:hypothetical protein n=1 Tax=Microbulbifer sp. 2201CG32-9 TaxID=3232309 RepID=UPI00345B53BD